MDEKKKKAKARSRSREKLPPTDISKRVDEYKSTKTKGKKPEELIHPDLLKLPNVFAQGLRWKHKKKPSTETSIVVSDADYVTNDISIPDDNKKRIKNKGKKRKDNPTIKDITSELIPQSPKLGPFEISDAKVTKSYYWCSCGLSSKQPFCNGMHFQTQFKPLKFILKEKEKQLFLCGCKMTQTAPFCDGKTCLTLRKDFRENVINENERNRILNETSPKI